MEPVYILIYIKYSMSIIQYIYSIGISNCACTLEDLLPRKCCPEKSLSKKLSHRVEEILSSASVVFRAKCEIREYFFYF
jgi:hypothetical protein